MNELIKIEERNGQQLVSGRDLHKFLEIATPYKKWFDRMCEYEFVENKDFVTVDKNVYGQNGQLMPQTESNHLMTIAMAKEISMIQRNEKGKIARQYFIKCEEAWNSEDMILARALEIQNRKVLGYKEHIEKLELENKVKSQQIAELKPKATYYDMVLQCKGLLSTTVIAKDYGKSAQWLNEKLHELGIQYKQCKVWLLYQKYASLGLTQTKMQAINRSTGPDVTPHTYWTQKGRLFIYGTLKNEGILPNIERDLEPAS